MIANYLTGGHTTGDVFALGPAAQRALDNHKSHLAEWAQNTFEIWICTHKSSPVSGGWDKVEI